ncbi:hypothetical protein K504DRAFT_433168 [Pleomassaria siparia CBS 279.74]|uniref:Alpha/beta hydrolase fold-3 domain-containing protein n=1 Tax=Pleomassaria siparia CBS 279.74 TaxID=1314801 RepID=A0A6G1K7G9_9PLEO|nr:hypothetical protein K504DRAFT_433168 [Pleomassaria siparia CBS 279.74]
MSSLRIQPSQIEVLIQPDPELQEFLSSQTIPDPPFTDIEQCRTLTKFADDILIKSLDEIPDDLLETTIDIPVSEDYTSSAHLVRPSPTHNTIPGPLIILFHPSGWFVPSTAKLIPHARGLATLFGATVLSPRYRLAPEHPFPVPVEDAWAVVQWAVQNTAFLGADAAKGFILGGISTGANLAVALARRGLETALRPAVTGIWAPLFIGLGDENSVPEQYRVFLSSRQQNKDQIIMNAEKADILFAHYRPDFNSPLFNPLARDTEALFNLSDMPRTHIQVAGADLFRDDGIILAYALQDCGVDVKLNIYPGMPHSFWFIAPHIAASRKCLEDIVVGFAWLLRIEVDSLAQGWETLLASIGCQPNLKLEADFVENSA